MKLKIKNKFLFLLAIIAICTSCAGLFDDLATNPNHQSVDNFYNTPENINEGVIGIYSYMTSPRTLGATAGRLIVGRSDESTDKTEESFTNLMGPSLGTIVQPFQLFYTSASQACQMIKSIPEVQFANKELQDVYLGEAYFLRAYAHWFLFAYYRNIPLMDELPTSSKNYKKQAAPEETWDFIIGDLIKAKSLLPNKGYWTGDNVGRVTKASAVALLGKAYLYRSGIEKHYGHSNKTYYTEAAQCFDDIITGKCGNYILMDDYNDNFRVTTENNDESILEFQFIGDPVFTAFDPGSSKSGCWRDPRGAYPPSTRTSQSQVVHDWVYNAFVNSKDANGYTDSRMFGTLVFDDSSPDIKTKPGDKVTVYGGQSFKEYYGEKGFGSVNDQAGKYKAACRKHIDWALPLDNPGDNMHVWNARAHGINFVYIRYADVLLMYAESVFNGGAQGKLTAVEAVNEVRQRKSANMPPVASVDMDVIENERILELTQESHRFLDLLRWGKLAKRFKELEASDPNFGGYSMSKYTGFKENRDEWLPIPVDEVEGNPYITQNNPGW